MTPAGQGAATPPLPCPGCASPNSAGQRFCGNCGCLLTATPETVESLVKREVETRLKDQKVVAVEIAESVYDRISKWAKIFVLLCMLPLGAAFYLIYGQYTNLTDLIKNSRTEAERVLAAATRKAHEVDSTTEAAGKKAAELNSRIVEQGKTVDGLDGKVSLAQTRISGYDQRMHEYESEVSKSGKEALNQIETFRKSSNTALEEVRQLREVVSRQQKELTETGTLVKELASRSMLEGFKTGMPSTDFILVTRNASSHLLAMRLKRIPYRETVRVQWYVAVQPPDSYFVIGNIVILPYWEDTAARLSERSMFVSYIADENPPAGSSLFKALSEKAGALLADGQIVFPAVPPRKQ
jgi:hypothetical protein